ncbi:hypothetical protein N8198_07685 [Gammaproteobacteria bacterium]|nr:hypothetical protein [Gammaproteobacteria bacterium]
MHSQEIRALIREVLEEEVRNLKQTAIQPATETVAIDSDSDLNAFARKLATLCKDTTVCQQLLNGQRQFKLTTGNKHGSSRQHATTNNSSNTMTFEKGLLNEKSIDALPDGTRIINVGPNAHFTPLARDRMRQRGITLKKVKP